MSNNWGAVQKSVSKSTTTRTAKIVDNDKKLMTIACHEAGHAVLSYKRQLPFRYVTIKPDEGSVGHLRTRNRNLKRGWVPVDDIVCVLAGMAAEKRLTGRSNYPRAEGDWKAALFFATARDAYDGHYDENDLLPQAIVKGAWQQVQFAVEWWWPAIRAVADSLLERETLKEIEVIDMCNSESVRNELIQVQRAILERREKQREKELAKFHARQKRKEQAKALRKRQSQKHAGD